MLDFFKRKKLLLIGRHKNHHIIVHLKNGKVFNLYQEDLFTPSEVGSIYKARIEKNQKGLNASFVDMGKQNSAFLYTGEKSAKPHPYNKTYLSDDFKVGRELMVQVTKDPLKGKSQRATHKISLPGVYLVYLPNSPFQIRISKKITKEAVREKLLAVIKSWNLKEGGIIVRTKASVASIQDLEKDFESLKKKLAIYSKSISRKKVSRTYLVGCFFC